MTSAGPETRAKTPKRNKKMSVESIRKSREQSNERVERELKPLSFFPVHVCDCVCLCGSNN